jgi:hypothetical protein
MVFKSVIVIIIKITTTWSRVVLEKLLVIYIVKKFPVFLQTPYYCRDHSSPSQDRTLSQLNPVYIIIPYLFHDLFYYYPSTYA